MATGKPGWVVVVGKGPHHHTGVGKGAYRSQGSKGRAPLVTARSKVEAEASYCRHPLTLQGAATCKSVGVVTYRPWDRTLKQGREAGNP